MVTVLNNTYDELLLGNNEWHDEIFTAAGANTYAKGTVLARLDADSKMVVYISGGTLGQGVPLAILMEELITSGAGDTPIRPAISGKYHQIEVTAYNAGTPLQLTALERDQLRDFGLIGQPTNDSTIFDNS